MLADPLYSEDLAGAKSGSSPLSKPSPVQDLRDGPVEQSIENDNEVIQVRSCLLRAVGTVPKEHMPVGPGSLLSAKRAHQISQAARWVNWVRAQLSLFCDFTSEHTIAPDIPLDWLPIEC